MLTAEEGRALLRYDPDRGILIWRVRPETNRMVATWNARYAGREIVSTNGHGYVQLSIHKRKYEAHRVIWLLVYGRWPDGQVDHENRIKNDNRIENLRLATREQNCWNVGLTRRNSSGAKGVYWHRGAKKWAVKITRSGKHRNVGLFADKAQAVVAFRATVQSLDGPFANSGIS